MTQTDELEVIRKLLVLALRKSGVSPDAIGKVLDVSGKTVENQYPLGNNPIRNSKKPAKPE